MLGSPEGVIMVHPFQNGDHEASYTCSCDLYLPGTQPTHLYSKRSSEHRQSETSTPILCTCCYTGTPTDDVRSNEVFERPQKPEKRQSDVER